MSVVHKVTLHGRAIGEGISIGINSFVFNNAVVVRKSNIGANALVPEGKENPDGSPVIGSPGSMKPALSVEEITGLKRIADRFVEKPALCRSPLKAEA